MNVIPYFVCVALGIAISETYHFRNKIAEQRAYDRGYKRGRKQALKELEEPTQIEPTEEPVKEPKRRMHVITEQFMEDLHNNGRAVIKFGGANNE